MKQRNLIIIGFALLLVITSTWCYFGGHTVADTEPAANKFESLGVLFSGLALGAMVYAIIINFYFSWRELRSSSLSNINPKFSAIVENLIGNDSSLLKFHGIKEPDKFLRYYELTSKDFAYLLASFSFGGLVFRAAPGGDKIISYKGG